MTAVVEAHELRKSYGTHVAVAGLDLRVERGTVFGLIGPNGAGKTTMLRMIVDLIRPSGGTLLVLGVDPRSAHPALRRSIGYLPGEFRLSDRTTGAALLSRLAQLSGPIEPNAIEALAERLHLDLHRPARALSKGNRQKLGLVQAFMHRPELLVLDEPTSGLDPLVQREFLAMVREAREAGQTVLLSSHILSEIQHTADEIAVLVEGRILSQGDVSSLRLSSVSRLRALITDAAASDVWERLSRIPELADLTVDATASGGSLRITATIRGLVDPVVKALAAYSVRDLTIEEPDLEESVLDLYSRSNGTE